MKILIPIISFGSAGGYRVLSELANHWTTTGHHVYFLTDVRSAPPYFPTHAKILRFDKTGHVLEELSEYVGQSFKATGNAFSIYWGMLRVLQRIGAEYDVILANHSLTALPIAIARTGQAKKFYYIQAYEPEYYSLNTGFKAFILKWLSVLSYKLPLHQIANAPIYIGYRSIRATEWIPPGLDESIFYPKSTASLPINFPTWTLGVIGRHEPSKGTKYVLEAFEKLAQTNPNIRLKVAFGNLPEGWSHERVEIVIPRNDNELGDFYRSIDIMIAPGTVQLGACHYPVLEAMACGVPVVTTGYLPADTENSWIVPIADSHAIEQAIERIMFASSNEIIQKLEIGKISISNFYWEIVANKFLNLISLK
jgi:glycosyltransferase involved in cell wall biosynthesis